MVAVHGCQGKPRCLGKETLTRGENRPGDDRLNALGERTEMRVISSFYCGYCGMGCLFCWCALCFFSCHVTWQVEFPFAGFVCVAAWGYFSFAELHVVSLNDCYFLCIGINHLYDLFCVFIGLVTEFTGFPLLDGFSPECVYHWNLIIMKYVVVWWQFVFKQSHHETKMTPNNIETSTFFDASTPSSVDLCCVLWPLPGDWWVYIAHLPSLSDLEPQLVWLSSTFLQFVPLECFSGSCQCLLFVYEALGSVSFIWAM